MADNTIDTLDLEIKSDSAKAVNALDKLASTLYSVNKAFKSVNSGGMRNYAREIRRVSASISALSSMNMNTKNMRAIGKEFEDLGKEISQIDTSKIKKVSDYIGKLNGTRLPDLSNFSKSFQEFANINVRETGINNTINGLIRLSTAKIGLINPIKIAMIGKSIKSLASVSDVSPAINRFISSFSRLANAGDKTGKSASSIANLGRQLRKTITNLSGIGQISEPLNLFVQSIGRLASAGGKAGETANGLKKLSSETLDFFNAMKNAPRISQNTIDMTQALAQLASAGGNVSRATNSITKSFSKFSTAGNIAKTALNGIDKIMGFTERNIAKLAGKISESFKRITSSSHGLKTASFNLGNLLKTAIGFRIGYGLLNFGKYAINLGSSITEVQNVVDVAFGSMSGMVDEFARTADEKFGLSELAAKQYSGTMMAMLKSSGVVKESAAEMSTTLAGLAGDIASFYNIDTDLAFQKIRSGIAGEIEPLRQLGISMTVANLEAFALSQGITKSYQAMTQAEQAMLRYNYLMWASADAQGDFARTSMNWANQVRMLTLNFQQLAATIGQGLIAAILPAVQALNALMGKLMQAAETFRNFIYTLMGKKLEGSQGGIVNDLAGIGDTSTGLENLGSAGGDAASGMEDATGAAQDLKKALSVLGFDELNQLSDSASAAGGAIGGIGGGGGGLDNIQTPTFGGLADALEQFKDPDVTPINEWAKRIREAFLAHDWDKLGLIIAGGVNKGLWKLYNALNWKNVGPKITAFTSAFIESFNSLVDGIDWNRAGRVVGTGINSIVNTFNQLVGPYGIDFGNIGRKLSVGFRGAIDEIEWTNLGNALGNGFMVSWRMLDGFVTDMSRKDGAGINGWENLGISVATALNAALSRIDFSAIGGTIAEGLNGAFSSLGAFAKEFEWDDLVDNIAAGINTFIETFEWEENGEKLNNFLQNLLSSLVKLSEDIKWEEFGYNIGVFLSQIDWLTLLIGVVEVVKNTLAGLFSGMDASGIAEKAGNRISEFLKNVDWNKFSDNLSDFITDLCGAIKGFLTPDKFEALGESIGSILSGLPWSEIFTTTASVIVTGLVSALNGLWESGLSGKIAAGISAAFLAVKILNVTGIGTLAGKIVSHFITKFETAQTIKTLADSLGKTLSSSASTASTVLDTAETAAKTAATGGFKKLLAAIGSSGAGIGLIAVLPIVTDLFAGFIEKLMGGNGITSQMGGAIHDLAGNLQQLGTLTGEQREEVWKLVEAWETQGLTGEEMVSKLVEKFTEWGLSTDQVNAVLQDNDFWTTKTAGDMELLAAGAEQLGDGFSKTAGQIDLSSVKADDALGVMRDALVELAIPADEVGGIYKQALDHFDSTAQHTKNAQQALDIMVGYIEETGISADALIAIMQEKFPEATESVKTSVETNVVGAQKTMKSEMGSMESAVSTATSNIKSDAEKNLYGVQVAAEESGAGVNTATVLSWGNSAREVTLKVREMKLAAATELSNMTETVRSYSQSMYNIMTEKFEFLSDGIQRLIQGMDTNVASIFSSMLSGISEDTRISVDNIVGSFASIADRISHSMGNSMYSAGRNAAQSFSNGISSVHIPMPHISVESYATASRDGYSYRMNSSVNWYKKGGLFGMPAVIGVGEAGKEAVLPLENRRTMSMIADSIMSSAPVNGVDENMLKNAVAQGVAMAMMNNQQNSVNVTCYAELKTENDEVLARAVTRGQRKLDYRMNPSPQFGY